LAQVVRPVQERFATTDAPDVLVGLGQPDDAAVYRLDDSRLLVFTTDFFTPVVDDPYQYGAIAAANAISDVYAMGAMPVLALNIAALPPDLPIEISQGIMRGMADKVYEAGAVIAGGHTIQDKEPKVGLAVIGFVHPDALTTKASARVGDLLLLTKPLGTGVITTALKSDRAQAEHVAPAIASMMRLNRAAAESAAIAGVHAMTDITGFGLPGHAIEMADASGVSLAIAGDQLPFLDGAFQYAAEWIFPGGSSDNALAFEKHIHFQEAQDDARRMLFFDAQTSGGLLIALPPTALDAFADAMAARDAPWWQIGEVRERQDTAIVVSGRIGPGSGDRA
jgi:selenide, water dikinase